MEAVPSNQVSSNKRTRSDVEAEEAPKTSSNGAAAAAQTDDASSSDDDIGPQLPSAAPKKKRRVLPYEKLYISALPSASRYAKSLMHKDQLSFVTITPSTDFLITSSIDGVVKFWKKVLDGVEFVKEFRAHTGAITAVSASADGRSFATAGEDKTIKIFDVVTFDLLSVLTLDAPAPAIAWAHQLGASLPLLACSSSTSPTILIFDGRGTSPTPLYTLPNLHRSPVHLLAYNAIHNVIISADTSGMLEYFTPSPPHTTLPSPLFAYKSSTHLFDFKRSKSVPSTLTISPTGSHFATTSFPDRRIRIFDFATARLHRTYDESLETLTTMQQAGTALQTLEDVEFGRRLAAEREIEAEQWRGKANVVFDESGNFILYGSLLGVKVLNLTTNRAVKVFGREDGGWRVQNLALYQGQSRKKEVVTVSMAASANPLLKDAEAGDPMLVATGLGKQRFYLWTDDNEASKSTRDVLNERPTTTSTSLTTSTPTAPHLTATLAILHTSMGDIHIRLFPSAAPKAVENFVTHANDGYYNNTIFHRVIRKFMIQGGDPLGDGTGGESIWGGEFEDEFSTLKHDKPYTVSMANAGPNSNGSQFFITTEKASWLDGKHTIFGRAVKGLDVVHSIESVRTHKEKPEADIRIVNITVV